MLANTKQLVKRARSQWVKIRWARNLHGWGIDTTKPVLLHIGCGDVIAPGYINVDARAQPHIHIVTSDLFNLQMIPDSAVDLVYMCHVLEHLSHRRVVAALREMHRILRIHGILRLSVPDFDLIIAAYQATNQSIPAVERALMGGQNYGFNYHYAVFNQRHLQDCLEKGGFSEVRPWDPWTCEHHDFSDWASKEMPWGDHTYPISLNLEGIK